MKKSPFKQKKSHPQPDLQYIHLLIHWFHLMSRPIASFACLVLSLSLFARPHVREHLHHDYPFRQQGSESLPAMDQLSLKKSKPKCRLFLKLTSKGILGDRCLSVWGPLPPRFLFGAVKKFCRFRIWSNTQSCICSPHNLIPPVTHCMNTYSCTYLHREGGGGGAIGEPVRRLEGR